jgi:hypothetical protein
VSRLRTPLVVAIALLVTGCAGGTTGTATRSPNPTTRPTSSPKQTLTALLGAEERGDHAASFALLSSASRSTYTDVDDWSRLRSQVPAVTGFTIASSTGASVVAVVEHEPGLDPFIGLSPARTRETWTAVAEHGSWRFDAEPRIRPMLPDRRGTVDAALRWAHAVQSCDAHATVDAQAVARPFGQSDGADQLCGASGRLAGSPTDVPTGPQTADLVSQYTADSLSWAQAVRVDGGPVPFSVVLAPIGDEWKVVAVFDGS